MEPTISFPPYYGVSKIEPDDGMALLRDIFPDGKAGPSNFVMFSTGGVHGSYLTIEDVAKSLVTDDPYRLTILIVRPRTAYLQYGEITVRKGDIAFLKRLRRSSRKAMREW